MVQAAAPTQQGVPQQYQYQCVLDSTGQPEKLGSGAYGVVYRYKDRATGEDLAVKQIALTNLPPHKVDLLRRYLPSELENHYILNHPHVVKLKDVYLTKDHLNIVLEMAEAGMLFQYVNSCLKANNGQMTEADARWFFQQLVLTMEYFHRRGVAHRDIKLENTLLKRLPGWARPIIKVADFGLSKHDATLTYTRVGTTDYMGPEVLTAQRPDGSGVGLGYNGEKADIWSAGVMMYAMLAGRYPFPTSLPEQQRLQLMTKRPLQLPPRLSPQCRGLLEALLHPNPDERITISGIKQHPWFLQELPQGALNMTEHYANAPSACVRSLAEVKAIIADALQVMDRSSQQAA